MHVDRKDLGPSSAKAFGNYCGGAVWEFGLHWSKPFTSIRNSSQSFEGRLPHAVRPFTSTRIPFVFLVRKGCQAAVKDLKGWRAERWAAEAWRSLWGKVRRAQAVPTALAAKSLACCALGGRGFGFALSAYSFSSGQFSSMLYCFGFRIATMDAADNKWVIAHELHLPAHNKVFLWLIDFATVLLHRTSGIKNGHGPEVRRKKAATHS